jgi:hypothetical protein
MDSAIAECAVLTVRRRREGSIGRDVPTPSPSSSSDGGGGVYEVRRSGVREKGDLSNMLPYGGNDRAGRVSLDGVSGQMDSAPHLREGLADDCEVDVCLSDRSDPR